MFSLHEGGAWSNEEMIVLLLCFVSDSCLSVSQCNDKTLALQSFKTRLVKLLF